MMNHLERLSNAELLAIVAKGGGGVAAHLTTCTAIKR